jgi:GDP-L-fucose synthase
MNKDSKIAIAGGTGFLGTALVKQLRAQGYNNIVLPSRDRGIDFTRQYDTERFFMDEKPEVVINLAALAGGIGLNRDQPGPMFYVNMAMGLNITHWAHQSGCSKYIYTGSICSYPKFTDVPFKEEDLWKGYPEETNAPYGIVKKSIGTMIKAYAHQYGFNGLWLMPVNLYGPHDNFDLKSSHVIPALIRKFIEAKENGTKDVPVWGDGSPSREFLYVEDCAQAIVMAMEKLDNYPDPINIGNGFEIQIASLAHIIAGLVGYTGPILWDTKSPNGQPRRRLDTTKAHKLFGFQAQTNLVDGLKQTIEWFKLNRSLYAQG